MTDSPFIRMPRLNDYIAYWASKRPDQPAMIQHEDGKTVSYREFNRMIDFFALRLMDMGIGKGDRVASMLVLVPEHMMLMYACFKIGAIFCPLDLRLKEEEVVRDISKIRPKAFFFLGKTPVRNFMEVGRAVKEKCPYVEHLVQFTPNPGPGELLDGAVAITSMMDKKRIILLMLKNIITGKLKKTYSEIEARTPALIIYTTGTTGDPKPAVLCHENIIVQNEILARGMNQKPDGSLRILINLPPSHVGCVTECFMTTMFLGGTTVLLRIFDVKMTLDAIEKRQVNALGQIPTQFRMLWNHPDYGKYDLSSLKFVAYAGSAVDIAFLKRLSAMAPMYGTGIGMTENAGFATFTPPGITPEEMVGQVGQAFPDLAKVTVRKPMNSDGTAGEELPDGETGEICYHPPIVFLGYYNMPDETKKTISKEGILYTGDLGYFKDMGSYKALHLAGRRKFIIKQKGYNVFPDEVESFIARLPGVEVAEVVGVKHEIFDEGIFAFVKVSKGAAVTPTMVLEHCRDIASYKRPQHVEIWPEGEDFPITRSTKVDKLTLGRLAGEIVARIRKEGGWDAVQKNS
ncbi:MAG: long-chain fatty acid--CoA ligase [Desulfobacteraceae bacterium]|nr:MAG: long-chain fatty acid--CoA ligase [Desulfobacteraceae bacterium]